MENQKVLRLSCSVVGEREKFAVSQVLDRGFLGMGQEVKNFENELASFIGNDVVSFLRH